MNFEEYFQRIGQAAQSVNELNQPARDSIASFMSGIEVTVEGHPLGGCSQP